MSVFNNHERDSILESLNEQQRMAVLRTQGPMLVLAGAGTGKTTVITHRIAHMIASGVRPEKILAVTFTKKAAQEMKQRVSRSLAGTTALTVCTFHALGHLFLRENRIRTSNRGTLKLIPPQQQRDLVGELLKRLELVEQIDISNAIRDISATKTTSAIDSKELGHSDSIRLASEYQRALISKQQIDFDDLLILPVQALQDSIALRQQYQRRWRYILVDEYQDTNELQHRLVQFLVGRERNLCVVGDDDQSIYGFRGASADQMLNFGKSFPSAQIIKLEQNYRSSSEIIDVANSVIERAAQRYRKRLVPHLGKRGLVVHNQAEDAEAEAAQIADSIKARHSTARWSDMAVLFRVGSDACELKCHLKQRGIPYRSSAEGDRDDRVSIMTLHRSKGLEFPIVVLPALEEDTLPHYHAIRGGIRGIEEERRLLYVGITRARHELILSSCGNRGGRPRTVSRFLSEVGK